MSEIIVETRITPQPIYTAPGDGTDILVWDATMWRPVRWCGWGGGVWQCSATGHNITCDDYKFWIPMLPSPEKTN